MDNNKDINILFAEMFADTGSITEQTIKAVGKKDKRKSTPFSSIEEAKEFIRIEKLRSSSKLMEDAIKVSKNESIDNDITTKNNPNKLSIEEAEKYIAEQTIQQSKELIEKATKVSAVLDRKLSLGEETTPQDASDIQNLKQQVAQLNARMSSLSMRAGGGGSSGGGAVKLYDLDDVNYTSTKTPANGSVLVYDSLLKQWVAGSAAPLPPGTMTHEVVTVSAVNQLIFTIASTPLVPNATTVTINGIVYHQPDWSIAGSTVTLSSSVFGASGIGTRPTDKVVISYVA